MNSVEGTVAIPLLSSLPVILRRRNEERPANDFEPVFFDAKLWMSFPVSF